MSQRKVFAPLINLLKPPRLFSWQTFALLSVILWIIAFFARNNLPVQNGASLWGCIFLLIAFSWFAGQNPFLVEGFSINYWMLGILIGIFVGSLNNKLAPIIWLLLPIISATIGAWPLLVKSSQNFKSTSPQDRAKLIIWFLGHLVITCWVQFNLLIQDWLQKYPSLLTENFSKSPYVVKIQVLQTPSNGGVRILNEMERQLKTQINGKPWSEAEKLRKDANRQKRMIEQAKKQLPSVREKSLWSVRTQVSASKSGYNLQMVARWRGPGSNPNGYQLEKLCQINSVSRKTTAFNPKRRNVRRQDSPCLKGCGAAGSAPTKKAIATPSSGKIASVKCGTINRKTPAK